MMKGSDFDLRISILRILYCETGQIILDSF